MSPFKWLSSADTMFSPQPPRVVASHRGIAHVSLVKTHKSLLLHGAGSTDGPVSRVIARVGSRPAGPAATAAAAPYPAATAAAGRPDCALSRRAIGAGIDRIDLSARNSIGGALGREESESQRSGSGRCDAKRAVGSERQGINVGPTGAGNDER